MLGHLVGDNLRSKARDKSHGINLVVVYCDEASGLEQKDPALFAQVCEPAATQEHVSAGWALQMLEFRTSGPKEDESEGRPNMAAAESLGKARADALASVPEVRFQRAPVLSSCPRCHAIHCLP